MSPDPPAEGAHVYIIIIHILDILMGLTITVQAYRPSLS